MMLAYLMELEVPMSLMDLYMTVIQYGIANRKNNDKRTDSRILH